MTQGNRPSKHCHKMVAATAKAMTADLYEDLMGHNELWEKWKQANPGASPQQLVQRFVSKNWSKAIEPARVTLALLLRSTLDESLKNQIHEALVLDATLIRGRGAQGRTVQ